MKQMRDISEEKWTVPSSQEVDAAKEEVRAARPAEVRANSPAVPVTAKFHGQIDISTIDHIQRQRLA